MSSKIPSVSLTVITNVIQHCTYGETQNNSFMLYIYKQREICIQIDWQEA